MKFTLPIYTSLLALSLTSTLATSSQDAPDSSIRLPLRKRSSSLHRDNYLQARSDLPTCDFKQLDRRLVQIEKRYAPDQNSEKVLKHRQNFQEKWTEFTEDVQDSLLDFFGGKDDQDQVTKVGQAALSDKTSHSSTGSQVVADVSSTNKQAQSNSKQVKTDPATEKLSNQVSAGQDIEFFAQVTVGTPGQTFNVNPDSGSADFWVVSNQCQSKNCASKKEKFDSSKSSTYSAQGNKDFKLTYGIGGVSGTFFRDDISVAGVDIKNQTVAQASKLSRDYRTDQAEGVMGLGFRSITSGKEIPVLQRLFAQHSFPKQLLAFAFGRSSSNTVDKSEMSIGSINTGLIKGDVHYTPVTKKGFWQFSFDSLYVGNDAGTRGVDGIVDTGTSSIAMPSQQADEFHKGIKGSKFIEDQGYYTFPCSQEIKANFKLKDGTVFKINPDDMNLGKESDGSNRCVSAIMAAETGGVVVFGLTLLKNAYSVLDYENNQVGFASYSF